MKLHAGDGYLGISAPLDTHANHVGTAFGGSIQCLGTIACWGLLKLKLGNDVRDILIQEARTRFLMPLRSEQIWAVARQPDSADWQHFLDALSRHHRGRIRMKAVITASGVAKSGQSHDPAAEFMGRFVVDTQAKSRK